MRNIGLLVTQTHRPDKAFVLDRTSGKVGPNEGWLGNDTLPPLLVSLLARLDTVSLLVSKRSPAGLEYLPRKGSTYTLNSSSSLIPLTLGIGTENLAAFSARLLLI